MITQLFSEEAERATLGAILTNPVLFASIDNFLKPTDFFSTKHEAIYTAMGELFQEDTPIDPLTLSKRLEDKGALTDIGGPAYLTQLIRETPTSTHGEVYARMVQRASFRRQLVQVSDEIKALANDTNQPVETAFCEAERKLLEVTGQNKPSPETGLSQDVIDYMNTLDRRIETIKQGGRVLIPTGLHDFDIRFGGSAPGELTVIAGPQKMGKSTFALNIARHRARMGIRQLIFSTEMTKDEIIQKWVSMETKIPVEVLRAGTLTDGLNSQYSQVLTATVETIGQWPVVIRDGNDYYPLTELDVKREIDLYQRRKALDIVLIDGLWQMEHYNRYHSRREFMPKHEAVNKMSLNIARLAQHYQIPIDLIHQLNAAPEARKDKHPQLGDLADSIGVSRNAHCVFALYRESRYDMTGFDDLEVYLLANRNGPTAGKIKLKFDKSSELYQDMAELPDYLQ